MIVTFFFVLFAMAIVWLVLAWNLLGAIRVRHPNLHAELGSPRGFEPQATQALFTFLYTRRPERLGDPRLLSQAWFMRVFFPIYLVGFIVLALSVPSGA